jgi:hypothetical protein
VGSKVDVAAELGVMTVTIMRPEVRNAAQKCPPEPVSTATDRLASFSKLRKEVSTCWLLARRGRARADLRKARAATEVDSVTWRGRCR